MGDGLAIIAPERPLDRDRDWAVVVAAALGLTLSIGTLTVTTFGIFVQPLIKEFGWNRTQLSGAVALSSYMLALSGWFWGALIDRFGPRPTVVPSVVVISALMASLGFLTPNLWHFYLVFAAIPLLAGGASPLGYCGILVRKFDQHLGLALGLALTGIGLGSAIIPSVGTALIESAGWRLAYVALGAITLVVTLPAALFATRSQHDRAVRKLEMAGVPILPLLRTGAYVLICAAFLLLGAISLGAMAHFVPMMIDRGFAPPVAAGIAAVIGLSTIAIRVASGWMLDRVHARYVLATIALMAAAALILLAYVTGMAAAYAAALLLGAVFGAEADILSYQVSRYFGQAAFGRLYGIAFGLYLIGVGTGPLLMGASFDYLGGYRSGLLLFTALSLVVAVLALAMPAYDKVNGGKHT